MSRVARFDVGSIREIQRTPQGGLVVPSYPTRAGVFSYRNSDGTDRRELRHPDEVFAPESMASLRNAPITDLHPTSPVNPDNWQALTVGHVGENVQRDGFHLAAPLLIQHAPAITKIENKERRELSCGYDCDLIQEGGVWEGQPYDAQQTNIRYNHLAILPPGAARGGPSVSMRLDSTGAVQVDSDKSVCPPEDKPMPTMHRIDGIEYEAGSVTHTQAVDRALAKSAEALASQSSRADKAEQTAKDEKARADKASDPKVLAEVIRRRVDMLDLCRRVAKATGSRFDDADEEQAEGEDEGAMMLRIVKMIDPDFNPAGMSPDKIHGYAMGRIAALLQAGEDNEDETNEDTEAPGGEREQEVSGGVVPPAAPGRSDSRRRRDGAGSLLGIFGARRVASREDGNGEAVFREPGGGRKVRADSPEAAEQRMRKGHQDAWQEPLMLSKDTPRGGK